jgi:hypothetical protein
MWTLTERTAYALGVITLCRRSRHCVTMEPSFGPYRAQAHSFDESLGLRRLDSSLRPFPFSLGTHPQVGIFSFPVV